jgi:hypothetical protein
MLAREHQDAWGSLVPFHIGPVGSTGKDIAAKVVEMNDAEYVIVFFLTLQRILAREAAQVILNKPASDRMVPSEVVLLSQKCACLKPVIGHALNARIFRDLRDQAIACQHKGFQPWQHLR